MKQHLPFTLGATLLLSACGGGGGSATDDVVTFSELQSRFSAFEIAIGGVNFEDATPTADTNLPTSGSQSYTGIAVVGVESAGDNDLNDFAAVGSATLVADFSDQEITGTADNFYQLTDPNVDGISDASGVAIDGSLTYEFTQETAGENAYIGQVTGSVTPTNMAEVTVDLPGGAGFIGDGAEALVIEAFEDGSDIFSGVFATQD